MPWQPQVCLQRKCDFHAQEADKALRDATQLLTDLLQSDNILRELDNMIRRQEQLNEISRDLVLKALVRPLQGADKATAANMSEQQAELSKELRDIERRLLDSESEAHEEAQRIVEDVNNPQTSYRGLPVN